ncbi:MAG: ABC transporter ATP-binding protein [Kiritimatiellia bacterium]|jgi:ABC-type lipoprotein export system ATPase subunit|nr:ABC transporter ATP-binding protein [Kiritimatiellia bacterium]
MSSLIETIDIRRSFVMGTRTLEVLRGVSLTVVEGESLAISGMSGAGKSTLLHVMGGLDRPTAGRVLYRGRDLYAVGDRERSAVRAQKIGFVFQAYHLLPELTVLENVLLPGLSAYGAFLRGPRLRERAAMLLGRVGLSERALHRPNELSGGEQQRAAIARALMNGPELLLADEPTGNLDSKTGEDVLRYLFELAQEEGLTLVMVTHNTAVAARCSRHIELRDGRPVA